MGIVTKDLNGVVTRTVGYAYDVDDQRVSKTVDGVVENYYLDGNQIAFVTDGGGNETFHYLYGLNVDQVLAQDSATGMVWALADRLGSVDTLTDADGNVVDQRTFDSFGRLLSQSNPAVSFRYGYTGRELDLESGLDYYRARYYDSAVGRFVSVDPMGFGAGDTNLYRYVGNSSTNATDPSGMISWNDVQQGWNNLTQSAQKITKFWGDAAADAGTSVSQGISQVRLPSLNQIGQGFNNFGRSWDTATNFWSKELVSPIANSFSRSTQNGVNFYTNVVSDGQQRGGVVGTLEQGAGYIGGTIYSVPGAISDNVSGFVRANPVLATKLGGAVRAVGGVLEIAGGVATSEFGVGIPIVVKGVDDYQAGIRQLFTGQQTDSLIYGAVKNLTGSSNLAGFVDAGTSLAASSLATRTIAQRAAAVADARAFAGEAAVVRQNAGIVINVAESQQTRAGSGFAAFNRRADIIASSDFNGYFTIPNLKVDISPVHYAKKIIYGDKNPKNTRYGDGNASSIKTILKGGIDNSRDIYEIENGLAILLKDNTIFTSSGRRYGYHHDRNPNRMFPVGGPGTISITKGEFAVFQKMIEFKGLQGNAAKFFQGRLNSPSGGGLDSNSRQKLIDLYNSRTTN
jgi:RHS repeat-associated protein